MVNKLTSRILFWACLVAVALGAWEVARADFLIYKIPLGGGAGGTLMIVLQGTPQVNAGRTVSFVPDGISEPLYFGIEQVEIKRVPTTKKEFRTMLGKAVTQKDADAVYKAAVWALKKGLLKDFYAGVQKTLEIDPKHEIALRVIEFKKAMDEPLPEQPQTEADLRKIVKNSGMKIARSKHFLLLHDTSSKSDSGTRGKSKSRAEERLDLLEQVYESFLLLFHSQDVDLDIPRERLKVILFNDQRDYLEFARNLSTTLTSATGFWDPERNVSVFYDHGTDERFLALDRVMKALQQQADDSKRNPTPQTKEIVRFAKAMKVLVELARENSDIEVVSHEATHQMAGNTGLFPRQVLIPSWVHEGLATYFESPGEATWSGIGAVNEQRLARYRALENDREHSSIDFIVGDQIFDYARSHGATLYGYGQAWALTHFLMETHLKEFVNYYRMLGEMPPDVTLSPELLTKLFDKAFGTDRKQLDMEWRSYMRTLKTDMERISEMDTRK